MSHSKRNTSLAFFTAHERSLLRNTWGSQSTRLSRDSFLPFGSCRLCLLQARDPVACPSVTKADLFCRECVLNDLVQQRKEIKRLGREWDVEKGEREDAELRKRAEDERREVERFEKVAMGFEVDGERYAGGKKRKVAANNNDDGRATERRKISNGEASFWVPGVDAGVPDESNGVQRAQKPEKLSPLCPASTPSTKHGYSLKSLVAVKFTEDEDPKTGSVVRICPSCKKGLSNSSRAILAKPCGHVLCGSCTEQFMKPPDKSGTGGDGDGAGKLLCFVCETDVTEKPAKDVKGDKKHKDKEKIRSGMVEISCEGTGFAGGGTNVTKREGTAFQC